MKITNEILEQGKSCNGGWSLKQLALLGLKRRDFKKGWKRKLIGNFVPDEDVKRFLALKDAHLLKGKFKYKSLDDDMQERLPYKTQSAKKTGKRYEAHLEAIKSRNLIKKIWPAKKQFTEEMIAEKQRQKAERRRAEDETNTSGSKKYCCRTCFHYQGRHCSGLSKLSKVCQYWFNPNSKIEGLAYG